MKFISMRDLHVLTWKDVFHRYVEKQIMNSMYNIPFLLKRKKISKYIEEI